MEVLAISDHKHIAYLNQLRFGAQGHGVISLFSPDMDIARLIDVEGVNLDRVDVVYIQNMHAAIDGIRMARGIRGMTGIPIILAVNQGADIVKHQIDSGILGIVDVLIDEPFSQENFDQIVRDAQRLVSQGKSAPKLPVGA